MVISRLFALLATNTQAEEWCFLSRVVQLRPTPPVVYECLRAPLPLLLLQMATRHAGTFRRVTPRVTPRLILFVDTSMMFGPELWLIMAFAGSL